MKALAATPIVDENSGRPKEPPKILRAEVKPVTAKENPYTIIFEQVQGPSMLPTATTRPAGGALDRPAP